MSAKFRIAIAIYFGYAGVVMVGALDARESVNRVRILFAIVTFTEIPLEMVRTHFISYGLLTTSIAEEQLNSKPDVSLFDHILNCNYRSLSIAAV